MLPSAAILRLVHGDVGRAHQHFDTGAVIGRDGDPDRRADVDAVRAKLERLGNRDHDAASDPLHIGHGRDLGEEHREFVPRQPREQRATAGMAAIFRVHHDAQPVRDHDQQLVAAGMAEAVVDHLEAVEVDEQHRGLLPLDRFAEQLVRLGPEMEPVGERSHGIVHAERMRILDRGAHLGEQRIDRGGELGHQPLDRRRRRRHEVAVLHRHQPVAEGRKRPRAFAVRPLRRDVADQQAEDARGERRDDLLVELGDVEQRGQREDERRQAGSTRQDRVADFLRRLCLHRVSAAPEGDGDRRLTRTR